MNTRIALCSALLFSTAACTTTQGVTVKEMQKIAAGGHSSGVVLQATDGSTVRVDPNTKIRFALKDGSESYWFGARDLEIGEHGVLAHYGKQKIPVGWEEIEKVEAQNLSGSKSLALVIGSAAVIAAVVAMASDDHDHVSTGATVLLVSGSGHHHHHHHHHHYDGDVHPERCDHPDHQPPQPKEFRPRTVESTENLGTRALFSGSVTRRSSVEIVPAVAANAFLMNSSSGNLGSSARYSVTAAATLRFSEMFEVGGGMQASSASGVLGFARGGFNFYLEDEHRLSIPLYIDLGTGSDITFQTRFALGARLRVVDGLSLGIYPLMPTYSRFRREDPASTGSWTFPSALEVAFAF